MPGRVNRTKLLPRSGPSRDARLVVVATEDTHASPQYFEALQRAELIDRSRVRLVVRPPEEGRTAPAHLIAALDDFKAGLQAKLGEDEYWMVFDVDHRRDKELSDAASLAKQKGHRLAGSNPCFEVWLLLHETADLSKVKTYVEDSAAADGCVAELRKALGSYSKNKVDASRYTYESVSAAVERAAGQDRSDPWPAKVGSHVHRILASIGLRRPD
jgi:hypothetical protein